MTTPELLGPLLARSRNFVLIQNGIGIELDLQAAVPGAVVMSGCAWIDATVVDHGRTLRHGPIVSLYPDEIELTRIYAKRFRKN